MVSNERVNPDFELIFLEFTLILNLIFVFYLSVGG